MLLDCYIRQESRASWSSYYTDYFTMSNEVKQGGVLSAILFTLYLDKLLIRLKNSNIGCSINGNPTFAPGLLPPSRRLPPGHMPPRHLPPPRHCPPPEKNNKQRLRFNTITSIVIKSKNKDVKDEM